MACRASSPKTKPPERIPWGVSISSLLPQLQWSICCPRHRKSSYSLERERPVFVSVFWGRVCFIFDSELGHVSLFFGIDRCSHFNWSRYFRRARTSECRVLSLELIALTSQWTPPSSAEMASRDVAGRWSRMTNCPLRIVQQLHCLCVSVVCNILSTVIV